MAPSTKEFTVTTHLLARPTALHEPIEGFRGSHAGILAGLEDLQQLPPLTRAVQQARATAEATLRMFDQQVLPHHADEEKELFVGVLRSAANGAEKSGVEGLVTRLVAQHRKIESMWSALRPSLLAAAAAKPILLTDFDEAVNELVQAYIEHIRLEELVFLPLADEILARNPNHMSALGLSLHLRHAPVRHLAYL